MCYVLCTLKSTVCGFKCVIITEIKKADRYSLKCFGVTMSFRFSIKLILNFYISLLINIAITTYSPCDIYPVIMTTKNVIYDRISKIWKEWIMRKKIRNFFYFILLKFGRSKVK